MRKPLFFVLAAALVLAVAYVTVHADDQPMPAVGQSAPDFTLQCPDGSSPSLAEVRGRVVHVVVADPATTARLQQLASPAIPGVQVVVIASEPGSAESARLCATSDPRVAKGLAVYRGVPVAQLDGTEFVIDAAGWLRAMWYPGRLPDWSEPAVLRDALERIAQHPIPGSPGAGHVH